MKVIAYYLEMLSDYQHPWLWACTENDCKKAQKILSTLIYVRVLKSLVPMY